MNQQEVYALIEGHYREHFNQFVAGQRHALNGGAEDVVQEAFCKALQYWEKYDPTKPFSNFFSTFIQNAAADHRRAEAKRGMTPIRPVVEDEEHVIVGPLEDGDHVPSKSNPQTVLEARRIERAIAKIPREDVRSMVFDALVVGEKHHVIADKHKVSRQLVTKHVAVFKRGFSNE